MNKRIRTLIEKALDDALTPEDKTEFERLLDEHPGLADTVRKEADLHQMSADAAPEAFEPQFSQRVMRRIRSAADAPEAVPFETAILTLLRRLAPVPLTIAGVLATYNAVVGPEHLGAGASFLELLFGIPPVTIETLLGL